MRNWKNTAIQKIWLNNTMISVIKEMNSKTKMLKLKGI